MKAVPPANEAARLKALHEYRILDTLPEDAYDEVTRLASWICRTPIALITLIDSDRQWFKAVVGLDVRETTRDVAFCAHAILESELVEVPDLTKDPRFADNPFVQDGPRFRFYAAAPLRDEQGHGLGTLCVVDTEPRRLTEEQRELLCALSRQVMAQLELRRHVEALEQLVAERTRTEDALRSQAAQAVRHQAALAELAKSREPDLDAALRMITRVDAETLGVERVSVWFFSDDARELVCRMLYRLSEGRHSNGLTLRSEKLPRYFEALQQRRAIAAHDAVHDAATSEFAADYLIPLGISSMLDVPIWRHGRMTGVVCHEHTGPVRQWTPAEQDFAASVADMVSLAMETAEREQAERELRVAEQKAQRMADRRRAVAAAAAGVIGARTRADLRNVLEEACRSVVPLDAFFIQAYHADTHTFVGFGGRDAGIFSPPSVIPAAGTPAERVLRERKPLVTLTSSDAAGHGAEITGTGRRSESVVRAPILRGDDVLGILSVQSYTPNLYTPQDVEVIDALAALASTALSNIELLSQREATALALEAAQRSAQSLADRMRAVAAAAAGVVGADSLDALHEVLREACRQVIPFDAFTFALYDASDDSLEFLAGFDEELSTPADRVSVRGTPAECVIRERTSLVVLSSDDPAGAGAYLMGTRRRSESVIRSPILSGDNVLGVLAVHSYTPGLYGAGDVEVLETVASLAASAIRNVALASARNAAEEALRASEAGYRAIFDSSNDGIYIHDLETGAILDVNRKACETHGYSPEEFTALGLNVLGTGEPPYDAETAREYLRRAAEGEPQLFQWLARHRDGHTTWLEVSLKRVLINGQPRLLATVRDIQDRKMAEDALQRANAQLEQRVEERTRELQRSEEYFRSLIENTSDIIGVLAPDGTLVYMSGSWQRVLGWSASDLLGGNAFDLIHPDDVQAAYEPFLEIVRNPGATRRATFRFQHRDGSWRILEAVGQTVAASSAEQGVVVNSRDVTERKADEEALRQAKEEAEHAREAAETANRAKSEFLSRMSHELRTPMNSILGFAQLLAKRELPQDQRRAVDHILKAGDHLLRLINEVLDIARIEADRQQLSIEPVHVETALREALSLIRPLAAQRDCIVVDELEPADDLWALADRQRLAQVLLNLLSNAVKYNRPDGRVWLTWNADDGSDSGRVRIGVHDTGTGIARERMSELFVPFARLGAEQSEVEGTGLGLALSQRLVEAMDGEIDVDSVPGQGTTFWVKLHRAVPPLERLARSVEPVTPAAITRDGRPLRILYVEDNLANLALVEAILADLPVTLMPALQGQLGFDLAAEHRPDLILLDLHLPDMDGAEVLRRLQSDARTRSIPVIVITADATDASLARMLDAGARAYITKPIDVDPFLQAIRSIVEAGAGAQAEAERQG